MFYGDHLPSLPHVYKQSDFDNGQSGPLQFVPWVIVGSDVDHRTAHVHSWMMGSEILRAAGVALTPYYHLLAKAEPELQKKDATHQRTIEKGIYSTARLYLKGRLGDFISSEKESGDVATASSR